MTEAIIKGLLSSKIVSESEIRVSEINPDRRKYIQEKYLITALDNNRQAAALSDTVILAVKPQVLPEAIKQLEIREDQLLISIAAGITIKFLEKAFPKRSIVRVMPNNPALVQAGISAISKGKKATEKDLQEAKKIFGAVGEVIEVDERFMDAVTGLSGSGPAFVYMVIEAMEEAGKSLGIDKKIAEKLAIQTVLGSAKTLLETGKSAKELRDMVTSPGGTTIEGLKVLEKRKFAEALGEAVRAAAEKSKKLSR